MSTTPETDPVDSTGTADPVPATPDASAPASPSATPDIDTESSTEGGPDSDSDGTEVEDKVDPAKEKAEAEKLSKAVELIMKVAKEGEKSGVGVDAFAEAAFFFRNSSLTKPFWAAWELNPAIIQRELAMAEQSGPGEFLMRYLPMLNLRAYFIPGLFLAGLAKAGVLKFKLNEEEEARMKAQLGETPDEAAKVAYEAMVNEKVVGGIVLPYEGMGKVLGGAVGTVIGTVQPELKPVVVAGKVIDTVEGAKEGYMQQVRQRVAAMEVEAAQKKAAEAKAKADVTGTVAIEHKAVVQDLKPEVALTPAPAAATAPSAAAPVEVQKAAA